MLASRNDILGLTPYGTLNCMFWLARCIVSFRLPSLQSDGQEALIGEIHLIVHAVHNDLPTVLLTW